MKPRTVMITSAKGSMFLGNVFGVVRVEESEMCFFLYTADTMVIGLNKSHVRHDFPPVLDQRPVVMGDFFEEVAA